MQCHAAVLSAVLLSFTVGCSSTSVAPPTANAAPPPAAAGEVASTGAELDPVVCKREMQTGTRIARRVCMRQSQWDLVKEAGSKMATDVQRRTVQTGNTVNPN
jgi:hypothetical protein